MKLRPTLHQGKVSKVLGNFLTRFICSCDNNCVRQKLFDNFSLPRSLVPKLVTPAFGQGKFVCVYKKYFYAHGFGKQKAALT
jgi:hypothetical protein